MEPKRLSSKEKRKDLLVRLNKLVFVLTVIYAVLGKYVGVYVEFYIYLGFIAFTIVNALFLRYKYLEISKIFSLLAFNTLVFMVASSEPFNTGMHLHFVTAGAVALAVYGFEQWKGAIAFVMFSVILNILVFETNISFLPWREFDNRQAQIFFMLNTLIVAAISVYTILLISKFNFDSEESLKQNEKLIRQQNEELIKTNTELDSFVYSASHDLRAPLSTLTGLINLVGSTEDEQEKMEYLELMGNRVKSMDNFIIEIINYSRNSRMEVSHNEVNIKKLLETIVEDLHFMPNWDEVDLSWDFERDLILNTDKMRLKMIFSNIISNAIKYRDARNGDSWVKLKGTIVDNQAKVIVEDNGVGINNTLLDRIFDMFFRAHDHSTGSGLGLYIAREAVSKLSGSITVESTEGKGSQFTVLIPINLN